jgi:hypothetical protein
MAFRVNPSDGVVKLNVRLFAAIVKVLSAVKSSISFKEMPVTGPAKFDVAVVEVALNDSATTGPVTESLAYGDVVPIPTLPAALIRMRSADPFVANKILLPLVAWNPKSVDPPPETIALARPKYTDGEEAPFVRAKNGIVDA